MLSNGSVWRGAGGLLRMRILEKAGVRTAVTSKFVKEKEHFETPDGKVFHVGMSAEIRRKFTEKDVKDFAAVTGDANPIHLDEKFADKTRWRRRIVHGTLTYGWVLEEMKGFGKELIRYSFPRWVGALLGMTLPGPGTILAQQSMRYANPCTLIRFI